MEAAQARGDVADDSTGASLRATATGGTGSVEGLQDVLACIGTALYVVDAETQEYATFSPMYTTLLGYTLDDVAAYGGRQRFLQHLILSDEVEEKTHGFSRLQEGSATPAIRQTRVWCRHKDGSLRYMEDHWIPEFADGRLVRTYGILRDITTQKETEDALVETEDTYRTLFDSLADPIVIFEKQTNRILDCNRAMVSRVRVLRRRAADEDAARPRCARRDEGRCREEHRRRRRHERPRVHHGREGWERDPGRDAHCRRSVSRPRRLDHHPARHHRAPRGGGARETLHGGNRNCERGDQAVRLHRLPRPARPAREPARLLGRAAPRAGRRFSLWPGRLSRRCPPPTSALPTSAIEEDIPEALGFIDSSVTRMDSFINAVLKLSRIGRRELAYRPLDPRPSSRRSCGLSHTSRRRTTPR